MLQASAEKFLAWETKFVAGAEKFVARVTVLKSS